MHRGHLWRAGTLVVGVVALASGCTGRADAPEPAAPSAAVASGSPTGPPSVPLRTEVTHVAGRLPAADRQRLVGAVGRTVSTYLDQAFLAGSYPRTDFDDSFAAFTPGARTRARRDAALLTNQPFGSTTRSVRAARRTAFLSVLAPEAEAAGVTAALDVVLEVDRGARAARRVHLRGRLLLTPRSDGSWAIFGYDLNRSDLPAGGAS
jgi:hypothetical protein